MDILVHPRQLGVLCFVIGFLLVRWIYHRHSANEAQPSPSINGLDIEAELRAGRKVDAIRLCRQKYGYDLKDASDFINTMSARLGLHA